MKSISEKWPSNKQDCWKRKGHYICSLKNSFGGMSVKTVFFLEVWQRKEGKDGNVKKMVKVFGFLITKAHAYETKHS